MVEKAEILVCHVLSILLIFKAYSITNIMLLLMITKSSIEKLGEVRTKVTYPICIRKDALVVAQIVTHTVSKTGWGTVVSYLQLMPCRIR